MLRGNYLIIREVKCLEIFELYSFMKLSRYFHVWLSLPLVFFYIQVPSSFQEGGIIIKMKS